MARLPYEVSILSSQKLTHNIIRLCLEKPENFQFEPGQAIEVTLNKPAFRDDAAPFTLTNLPGDDHLELILKVYESHQGMTKALAALESKDSLFISPAWDSFPYYGKGVFIAGGAGITAFLPIIRDLVGKEEQEGNQLIWANKKHQDLFLKDELQKAFGQNFKNILSKARSLEYSFGRIHGAFLKQTVPHFDQYFYVCGPGTFPDDLKTNLIEIGADPEKVIIAY